jgi:hypothetical protein
MIVKDLIKKLQKVDPEMLVFCTSNTGEYEYCKVNTAGSKHLFLDLTGDGISAENKEELVFVIDEE